MFPNSLYLILTVPALLLALYAQSKIRSSYRKYLAVPNSRGITGVQSAQMLMSRAGLTGVQIEGVPGELTDHYDPRGKVLRLSAGVANSRSVAALGIVAHEVGHAQQDWQGYMPMKMRSGLVPVVNLGTWLGPGLFILGLFLQSPGIAKLGLIIFSAAVIFTAVTLPVELNASSRALKLLQQTNLLDSQELTGARSVLNAAALTYWAALAQSISQLLYYGALVGGMRDRD